MIAAEYRKPSMSSRISTSRFDLAHNEIAKSYDSDGIIAKAHNSDG
jgi:hypothetical protein